MAVYDNVKVKVFIHDAVPNIETAAVGTMARDIKDHIDTLDFLSAIKSTPTLKG